METKPFVPVPAKGQYQNMRLRLSYYNPALGGTNCHPANWKPATNPYGGVCRTALIGEPWSTWVNIGAACAPDIPLRSRIYIEELKKAFICVDRGGAIQRLADGTQFIDLLQVHAPWYPNAEVIEDKYCPSGCLVANGYIMP